MKPLEERCTSLASKFARLDSVNKDTEQTQQIEVIEAKAIGLANKSDEMRLHFTTLMDGGLCEDVRWNLTTKFRELDERLEITIKKARETPEKIKDDQTWAKCERSVHEVSRDLNTILKAQWKSFIDNKTQDRAGAFSAFREWPKYSETIKALEHKESQAGARVNQLPESPEDIAFIVEIDKSMTKLMDGIEFVGEPTEMIDFLKLCVSGTGVPLSELNDERLEWLRSKEFGENLRIRR